MTRRHLLAMTGATAAASVLPAGLAFAGDTATSVRATRAPGDVLAASAASLHPEGIAWDPTRAAFLVSSFRHGTVSVVRRDASVHTLVSDPLMVSTLGVRVDVVRRRVLVAFADIGVGARSSPQTLFTAAGLGIFDLVTGRPRHIVPLTEMPGGQVANDIALDPAGTAYVTNTASDGIYRVDPAGRASVFVRDARFANPNAGLNGIVWHPAGFLLAVSYTTGQLWRIRLDGTVREVELDRPLIGGDGMVLLPDGGLVVVTNAVLAPGEDAVQTLRGARGWTGARVVHRTAPWPDAGPSTATLTPTGVWAVAGSLSTLFQGGTSDTFSIRRYPRRG
jgi:sugar lactone lactonase YvrE